MKAMIFAAGLGTRLNTETTDKPKALVEVGGKTLLQRAIEKLKNEGINEIVVNVHHFSEMVISYLNENDFGIQIHISDESDKLLDTGGGLKKAACFLAGNEPILIYNVDIISDQGILPLLNEHLKSGALVTLAVRKRETQRYLKFDGNMQLAGWINRKTGETKISRTEEFDLATELAYSGFHIIQPEILQMMPESERFSVIDFYLDLAKTHTVKGFMDTSELWIDVGKPEQLEKARKLF